jgi:hypothetical protein
MTEFVDQRAIRCHGAAYERARDIICIAMVAAEADGRPGASVAPMLCAAAESLPGLGTVGTTGLRLAGRRAAETLAELGTETALRVAAAGMDRRDATAAMLLACEIAETGGPDGRVALRALARRLGIEPRRLEAIRILALRRREGMGQAA